MAKLIESMDNEKSRQKNALADRIAERRRQKETSLKQKHDVEMDQELVNQRKQRDDLNEKQVRVVNINRAHGRAESAISSSQDQCITLQNKLVGHSEIFP